MNTSCELKLDPETGCVDVCGDLTFATVNEVLASATSLFNPISNLEIDLANVTRSDSAGLALLIDWMRVAKQSDKKIVFHNIPTQMLAMAHASGLDELLPLQ